ncbi:hypothetical protein OAD67_02445 [bacterium]|jgi:hypothetical protein|nr:hypothetical protein [bacterium]
MSAFAANTALARVAAPAGRSARRATMARAATLRGAPDATLSEANSITSDDVSSWEEIDSQIAVLCASFAGDSSVNGRIFALTELGREKTYEALDDITVVDVYQAAYEGSLDECTTIIDVHLRLVAECIIKENVELVHSVYDKFRRMPPMLQKSSLVATAAVAEAGLLYIKEEYDLIESIMRDDISSPETSDDAKLEYEKVSVIIEYIDKVIAAIHEEKGEVDGEIKSDGVTITVETIDAPMVQPPDGVM